MAVIEQFEQTPLDLGGKRASQLLLRKKRRNRRRQRQRPRHTSADSEGEKGRSSAGEEEEEEEDDDEGKPSKARSARVREREAYKSAQFIEDSDEEYGHDIDDFFAREAAVRERTALAAVDSALGTGTMRATGTKKRRRPRGRTTTATDVGDADADDGGTRPAKRRAASQRAGGDSAQSESESGPESRVSDVGEQGPAGPALQERRPPKPRPRYRGGTTTTTTIGEPSTQQQDRAQAEGQTAFLAPDDEDVSSAHDVGDQGRNVSGGVEDDNDDDDDESRNHRVSLAQVGGAGPNGSIGSGPRKGRVIISDEDE